MKEVREQPSEGCEETPREFRPVQLEDSVDDAWAMRIGGWEKDTKGKREESGVRGRGVVKGGREMWR